METAGEAGNQLRVLVIDDDDVVRRTYRRILEHGGYQVLEARNGVEGIQRYEDEGADLILTDILMPEKDGLEVLMDLTARDSDIKVIAITGGGAEGKRNFLPQAQVFGAAQTLRKPLMAKELLTAVADVLGTGNNENH